MGGKYSLERWRWPGCSGGFSVLCGKQKKSLVETPLGFCDIEAQGNNLSFGTQNPSYLDMAYFPDNDLHMAACAGDLPFVRLYFTLGKYDVNHRDKDNRNALHFACFYGHLDMVNYLWRRGCQINVCDKHNITPLMKAVQSWEEEIVCYLLERHANLHIRDSSGNTAFHYAVYGGKPAMAARLLQYGANIEERTKDNLTPLLLALRENRLHMAQFLIKMEASVHAVDSHRRNSLMYAVRCDSSVMVNLLLQQGVDMNFKDLFGWTALRYAIEGDREVRTVLLDYEYTLIQSLRQNNSGKTSFGSCIPEEKCQVSRPWDTCRGKLQTGCGTSPRDKCVVVNKAERSWRLEELLNRDTEFRVCPAGFRSCFGPIFSHYVPFPLFWKAPQSSENYSSIRPTNKADAGTTSSTATENMIEMQDPLTTNEAGVKKTETCQPAEPGAAMISLKKEISCNETIKNSQQDLTIHSV
ncbi:ankyrin repeat domain-containing protein 18A isoform X3 [Cricetulus griseus]|uniref:Ankyrin repeat domain-containing protein 18A isoform X3 n=1 Tax=Cricetulus griseus TaxID=10029 RepID=A0A9J7FIU4_CRIGR|nr:ankyrin repeat domain-containing protein 18A isoform X3 [Cricetulus griseus]